MGTGAEVAIYALAAVVAASGTAIAVENADSARRQAHAIEDANKESLAAASAEARRQEELQAKAKAEADAKAKALADAEASAEAAAAAKEARLDEIRSDVQARQVAGRRALLATDEGTWGAAPTVQRKSLLGA